MYYEDVLPAIRAGRLARRREWTEGRCVGKVSPDASSISEFQQPNREGSYGSWSGVKVAAEMLKDDWELVPEVRAEDNLRYYERVCFNTLAQLYAEDPPPQLLLEEHLEEYAMKTGLAYKYATKDRLILSLKHGIAALAALLCKEKDEAYKAERERQERERRGY